MRRMMGKWLMKKLDVSKSSPACFLLAVDENLQNLKPYLEKLKPIVTPASSSLSGGNTEIF